MIRNSFLAAAFSFLTSFALAATVATPSFSPAAGPYTAIQTVTISTTTSGATIRYTTNGSTPSATAGTVYSTPVSIGSTKTLKAIAYKSGSTNSAVKSGTYTINLPTAATPIFSPAAGTFTSAQTVTIASTTSGASIRYTTDGSTPSATAGTVYSAPVSISATKTLKAIAYLTGYKNSAVKSGTYTINLPKVATPSFSPGAGTYTTSQAVAMTSTTPGALIAYTTDGTTPTESGGTITHGSLYTDLVSINATTTLKAIAFASGFADSSVKSGTYTLNLPVPDAPVILPTSGTYSNEQNVVMTTGRYAHTSDGGLIGEYNFSIAYTTDGTTPTASGGVVTHGSLFPGSLTINATTTLKAIAFESTCASSPVASATFAFGPAAAAPVFSPTPGTYADAQSVTITSATNGASILYTTDGSTPTETHGTIYSGPVAISTTTMLKAIAYVSGSYGDSPVASGLYAITSSPVPIVNVLYNFSPTNSGGLNPWASLVQGSDGNLYGTAQLGGSAGSGAVFKITPAGVFTPLVSFNGANGASPEAGLVQGVDGDFYGTTYFGGSADKGTVYKITPAGTLTTLFAFSGPDGANPQTGLVQGADGNFYGTTYYGGTSYPSVPDGCGTIFRITPAGGFTTLIYFGSGIAKRPNGDLMLGRDGKFYGHGNDIVFKMTPSGVITELFMFSGANKGSSLYGSLVQGNDNNFYGTTMFGGAGSEGTVFKMTPAGGVNTLAPFDGTNGQNPMAGLVVGKNGNFYGTTSGGFDGAAGTLFKINPAGVLTSLFSFNGSNGANPYAALVQGGDGNFYGTTYAGGIYNYGTVFQLVIPTTVAPIFSPSPEAYFAEQPLTITSTTPGATIRYTTNGSSPTSTSGTIYSGPISLSTTTTLKAIAYSSTLDDSAITSGVYIANLQAAAPIFGPGPGTYQSAPSVAVTSASIGTTIRYTTDGSMPTATTGTIYSGPLSIGATTTLNAIAYGSNYTPSLVTSGTYVINKPPTITTNLPASGTVFGSSEHVELSFNASDVDGTISIIEVYRNGILVSTLTVPTSPPTWTFIEGLTLNPGEYTYYALAYDTQGGATRSVNVMVTIMPAFPYMADFETSEGYTPGTLTKQFGWIVNTGTAQISVSDAAHGTQSVVLNAGVTSAQLEQGIGPISGISSPIYIDMYAKPVAGADATSGTVFDLDAGCVSFVLNGAIGQLFALDGDGAGGGVWKPLASAIALDANQVATVWQRLTARLNYAARTYDLYLNGQMLAGNLKFRLNTTSRFLRLLVTGSTTACTCIDDVYISQINPLFADININGIDDVWETAHSLSLSSDNRSSDPDCDGLTNVQEYIAETDPQDYYNGVAPALGIVSGNNQSAAGGQYNAFPMVVAIKTAAGTLLSNVPVTFSVVTGGGLLGSGINTPSAIVTLRTDQDGCASYYYLQPGTEGIVSQIRVTASSSAVTFSSTSTEPRIDPTDTDGSGLPDAWQMQYFGHLGVDPKADPDGDGLSNFQEYGNGTSPNNYSSMGDGVSDGNRDTDKDGFPDWQEKRDGSDPLDPSSLPVSTPSYAMIDLGKAAGIRHVFKVSDNGVVLGMPDTPEGGKALYRYNTPIALPTIPGNYLTDIKDIASNGTALFLARSLSPSTDSCHYIYSPLDNGVLLAEPVQFTYDDYVSYDGGHQVIGPYWTGFPVLISNQYLLGQMHFRLIYKSGDIGGERSHKLSEPAIQKYENATLAPWAKLGNAHISGRWTNSWGYWNDLLSDWLAPFMLNDKGDYILRGSYSDYEDRHGYFESNQQSLSYFPTAMNNNGAIIGFDFRDVWTPIISGGVLSERCLYPVSVSDSGDVLALDSASDTTASLLIRKASVVPSYTRINIQQCLPAGWYLSRECLLFKDAAGWKAELIQGVSLDSANATMTNSGIIAIDAYKKSADSLGNIAISPSAPILLVPATITMDANRDGQIVPSTIENIRNQLPVDVTSEDKPFRFWVNDDDDTEGTLMMDGSIGPPFDEAEKTPVTTADYTRHQIGSKRNLEDFARLWINLSGLQSMITGTNPTLQIGLKWQDGYTGTPAINIYPSYDGTGSDSYLKDDAAARMQTTMRVFNEAVTDKNNKETVDTNGIFIIKSDYWNGLTTDNPKKCLLFEGAGIGKGQLVIVILDAAGNPIGEGPGVWMDLGNIKSMYQRVKVTPRDPSGIPAPFMSGTTFDANGSGTEPSDDGYPFAAPADEAKTALVFVHGSNIPYEEARWNAETMLKRLWWQGYKGRFVLFYWDTLIGPWDGTIPAHYNLNEYRALKYGWALKNYVESALPSDYAHNVVGHSMGNAVIASALRAREAVNGSVIPGMTARNVVFMQAAMPASCFDSGAATLAELVAQESPQTTPDGVGQMGYRGVIEAGVNATLFNIYNENDYALGWWVMNQRLMKPEDLLYRGYARKYTWTTTGGGQLWDWSNIEAGPIRMRYLEDLSESMSFVARSRTAALGRMNVGGSISNNLNISEGTEHDFGRDRPDHSGEFTRRIQQLGPFYRYVFERAR